MDFRCTVSFFLVLTLLMLLDKNYDNTF